jgi:hypothetical protein
MSGSEARDALHTVGANRARVQLAQAKAIRARQSHTISESHVVQQCMCDVRKIITCKYFESPVWQGITAGDFDKLPALLILNVRVFSHMIG